MITTDDMMVRRDELMERAQELRERFADNVTQETVTEFAGLTLMSTGVAWALTNLVRGRRSVLPFVLPGVMFVAGLALLGNGALRVRGHRILEAEDRVRAELAALDPIARVQVMRGVAPNAVPFVRHAHN